MNMTELPAKGEKQRAPIIAGSNHGSADATQAQVLIHTKDALDETTVQDVIHMLNRLKGVSEIRFNPEKEHLIMVSYDPHLVESSQLLTKVKALGHEAQLVGL